MPNPLTDGELGDNEAASGPGRIRDPGGLAISALSTIPPVNIPTLSTWSLGLLISVLGLALLRFGRRRGNTYI